MFLKLIVLTALTSMSAMASDLTVVDGLKRYELIYSKNQIEFKASMVNLAIFKKPCSESLLAKFESDVQTMLKKANKLKKMEEDSVKVINDKKVYNLAKSSPSGRFFRMIPNEIKRLKIEESLRCKVASP